MVDPSIQAGRARTGFILFVILLVALCGKLVYRFADPATRLNDEAVELMNQDKYDSALSKLDEAIAADPEHIQAHYHRGICLAEKHRFDEAIEAFELTTQLDPNEANAYFNLGKLLHHLERYPQAAQAFERAIEKEKTLVAVNRKVVWMLLGDSRYEQHLGQLANAPTAANDPAPAVAAYKNYLKNHPDAHNRSAVEQKLTILAQPDDFKEVIRKRKKTR